MAEEVAHYVLIEAEDGPALVPFTEAEYAQLWDGFEPEFAVLFQCWAKGEASWS